MELYLEILKSLESLSRLDDIQQKTNVDAEVLESAMTFLEKQNLVEKENSKNEVLYHNTARGIRVTKFFLGQTQENAQEPVFLPDLQ